MADLLTSTAANKIKDVTPKRPNHRGIMAKKAPIEYENRGFIKNRALDMIKQVRQLYAWGIKQV